MGHGQRRPHWNPKVQHWHLRFDGNRKDDWNQQDDADFKEQGDPNDEGGYHDGNLEPFTTENID